MHIVLVDAGADTPRYIDWKLVCKVWSVICVCLYVLACFQDDVEPYYEAYEAFAKAIKFSPHIVSCCAV